MPISQVSDPSTTDYLTILYYGFANATTASNLSNTTLERIMAVSATTSAFIVARGVRPAFGAEFQLVRVTTSCLQ
jgi:hypothetical protein